MRISIAIPYHGNRLEWTVRTIKNCHNMVAVGEIIISAEPDVNLDFLKQIMANFKKVKVFGNDRQLFVFRNKVEAVRRCMSEWVALIDSDNVINTQYTDPLFREKNINPNIIYAPAIGFPRLDYSKFTGEDINAKRAAQLIGDKTFDMLLNTMNYVLHRETWLNALKDAIASDYEPRTADSTWINYNCLKAGMVMRVLKNMIYNHTIHPKGADKSVQSTYNLYADEGVVENEKIRAKIKGFLNENGNDTEGIHANAEGKVSLSSVGAAVGGQSRTVLQNTQASNRQNLLTD